MARGPLCRNAAFCATPCATASFRAEPMPSTDASTLPTTGRRWSLAAAIASVTVFGLSVGQGAPLVSLLLEQRGFDATLNGLNAGPTFIGVMIGPLLAPRLVRWLGIRNFLLVCIALDMALFLAMKAFDSFGAWLLLRDGRSRWFVDLHGGRGVDQSARRRRRARTDHRDLRRGAVGRVRHRPAAAVGHRHFRLGAVARQRRHHRAGDGAAAVRRRCVTLLRAGTRRQPAEIGRASC